MSYPNIIYGDFGEEKRAQSTRIGDLPLGQLMILPDGRKFRHAQAGSATDLATGAVVGTTAEVAGHGNISGSGLQASSVAHNGVAVSAQNLSGQNKVVLRTQTAAVTKDQYAGGYLQILGPAGSAYIGQVYRIKENESAAVSAQCQFTLEPSDPLKTTLASVSTLCSLRKSTYADAIVAACAQVGPIIGVTPVAVTKSFYFWAQRSGIASIKQGATVVVAGSAVMVGVPAGSIELAVAASNIQGGFLGRALGAAAASQAVLVDLDIE